MNYNIDHNIRNLLIKAGWNENRQVNRFQLTDQISKNGYEVLPEVVDFLEVFEGLTIRFPNLKNGINDDITLDFKKATELECPERIHEDYQPRIGKKLCIIGTAYRDHFVLIMAEDGKVYGGYDNYLVRISDTGIGAIEAIINNEKFTEIP